MYVDANREQKRQLLGSVTSNLTVDGKNLVIALSSPLDLIADRRKMAYGDPYRGRLRTLDAMLAGVVEYCRTTGDDKDTMSESSQVQAA
jgi:hypothetical protein